MTHLIKHLKKSMGNYQMKKNKLRQKRKIKQYNDFFATGIVYIDPKKDNKDSKRKIKPAKNKPKKRA